MELKLVCSCDARRVRTVRHLVWGPTSSVELTIISSSPSRNCEQPPVATSRCPSHQQRPSPFVSRLLCFTFDDSTCSRPQKQVVCFCFSRCGGSRRQEARRQRTDCRSLSKPADANEDPRPASTTRRRTSCPEQRFPGDRTPTNAKAFDATDGCSAAFARPSEVRQQ